MLTHDIKKALEFLIHYELFSISHHFDAYVVSFSNITRGFKIEDSTTGIIKKYKDLESCSSALYEILSKKGVTTLPFKNRIK